MLRFFLGASALLWLPYGVYCFLDPGFLSEAAGVTATSTTGTIELRAMYGGLQMAIGALALAGLFRSDLARPALSTLAVLSAGLFTARLVGAVLASEFSSYTLMGLCLEIVTCALATRLLATAPLRAAV